MTDEVNAAERREIAIMARRYGVAQPSDAVRQRYYAWISQEPARGATIERVLLGAMRLGRFSAWLASAYAGRFLRRAQIRRREVALLAFLECDAAAAQEIDESRAAGSFGAWLRFFTWGFIEVVAVVLSLPFFGPIHLFGSRS